MPQLVARIVLRYIAGILVGWGMLGPDTGYQIANDPDLAILLGMGIAAITEGVYLVARKRGDPT
ncbi:hypothetical protein [Paracoccus sp. SSJ]|uniref:hypothetical protein n=1 Tax=Paracoccus sp. SSJ TaxID=3050636 RepID=UPI0025506587|nr:hypothetical protein [Paracoccus sp. SSJ]MDK8874422.1 hypothetical protein [Paracoccus sp. SSJ]